LLVCPHLKLLTKVYDRDLLNHSARLLENAGIPVFCKTYGGLVTIYYSLFVLIDDQLEDAIKLLKDPNHVVSNPVDIDEFYRTAWMPEEQFFKKMLDMLLSVIVVLICGFTLLLIIYHNTHFFKEMQYMLLPVIKVLIGFTLLLIIYRNIHS